MNSNVKIYVEDDLMRATVKVFCYRETPEGMMNFVMTPEGITVEKIADGVDVINPFFEVSRLMGQDFWQGWLKGWVEHGASKGVFPEASHRERITAEAVAEERLEVINHERGQFGSLLDRIVGAGLSPTIAAPSPVYASEESIDEFFATADPRNIAEALQMGKDYLTKVLG